MLDSIELLLRGRVIVMKKFTVNGELKVKVSMEIEAESYEEALQKAEEIAKESTQLKGQFVGLTFEGKQKEITWVQ